MRSVNYITIEEAVEIHNKTIRYSGGGTYEHFDLGRLDSVLQNIQNDVYYPTFSEKLTHLFYCVCEFHCFADGNKRLAITLSTQLLLLNGYLNAARTFMIEMENISYHVAAGRIDKTLLHKIITAILAGTYSDDEELKLEVALAITDD